MTAADEAAHTAYRGYLALDELLELQQPNTGEHDELLFVIVHQVHELWFKQLLHEFAELARAFGQGEPGAALRTIGRLIAIVRVTLRQIDVLDTLTPGQFVRFRDDLGGSGFYSAQFREIEVVLGRRDPGVFDKFPEGTSDRERLITAMTRPPLFDSFAGYLTAQGFPVLPGESPETAAPSIAKAYREDGVVAQLCERMVDLDQIFTEWRYRHSTMARRIIGDKTGTGGSSGAVYLRRGVFTPLFPALWEVRNIT
ncbi:tryptophan 2,3-dioxygenase family protein [Amycolatopsis roodepoortensis]|uniref:tryptophan 2,3-dioxygenase n=1 Tax=Amycolatopsis roodepoortensis TaxID=700274 RepID=UPI00214C4BFB|nr:tryptophan 2,3-dioxygenase family protein [Amycolatopsis roodepoortensis]UUV29040.1 tryptophan 2,3-dioxygenase family protein [Amycolatopsis roodepoortensis]